MFSKRELRNAISTERDNLTDKDVFSSEAFKNVAEAILKGVGKIYSTPTFSLDLIWGNDSLVACVDEKCQFTLNVDNVLVQSLDRKTKYACLLGSLCHEVSHRLWTNFKELHNIMDRIISGSSIQEYNAEALNNYIVDFPEQREAVAYLYKDIFNIIEDGYIETQFTKTYLGFRKYLVQKQEVARKHDVEFTKENAPETTIKGVVDCILLYAKHHVEPDIVNSDEAYECFDYLRPFIDKSLSIDDSKKRSISYIDIVSELLSYLQKKEEEKNNQNTSDQSQNGQGSPNSSSSSTDNSGTNEQNNSGKTGGENSNPSSGDNGSESSSNSNNSESSNSDNGKGCNLNLSSNGQGSSSNFQKAEENASGNNFAPLESKGPSTSNQVISNTNGSNIDCGNELAKVENQAAEGKVQEKQEKNIQQMCNTLKDGMDFSNFHKNVESEIIRVPKQPKPYDFDALDAECNTILKRLVSEWAKQIHDLQIGQNLNGLYSGRRLTQAYRTDLKRFSSKKAPSDIPDMSVCLLVDFSGSMNQNGSIEAARKASLLIYKFCKELDVRFACYGHSDSRYAGVKLFSLADFDSIDGNDSYRIASMESFVGGRNRDGYAIRYCKEKLSKEAAQQKILIIISDGCPNSDNYGFHYQDIKPNGYKLEDSGNAKMDILEIEKSCAKEGISLITAGIDTTGGAIKDLYTYGVSKKVAPKFLEITDISKMPKMFVDILKKEIDKQR